MRNRYPIFQSALEQVVSSPTYSTDAEWKIHIAKSNENNTLDGIVAGGTRIANEINEFIHKIVNGDNSMIPSDTVPTSNDIRAENKSIDSDKYHEIDNKNICTERYNHLITLSIIGNSLGGLYGRFALSRIRWEYHQNDTITKVHPALFCTSVTPHLGVERNVYIPLPRFIEYSVATVLRQTGYDLFRCNDLLETLTTDPLYTIPLQNFDHRLLYANAYCTDSQVPFRTAAFLSNTNSIHYLVHTYNHLPQPQQQEKHSSCPFVSLRVQTKQKQTRNLLPQQQQQQHSVSHQNTDNNSVVSNEPVITKKLSMDEMAVLLDDMGWTKVFCDMRHALRSYPIRIRNFTRCMGTSCSCCGTTSIHQDHKKSDDKDVVVVGGDHDSHSREVQELILPINKINSNHQNQTQGEDLDPGSCYTSCELLQHYDTNDDLYRWYIPFGHSILIANCKTEWMSKLTIGGRPMVDYMAHDIIRHIIQSQEKLATLADSHTPILNNKE